MFTMSKFNKEQKIEIYRKWKDENISISQLSKAYKMNLANLDYMLRLIDMHGTDILNTGKQVYSKKFKEQAQVKRIVNEDNWNMFTYNLISIAFIILKPDEVKYFTHRAYQIFNKSNQIINLQSAEAICTLAVNFLIYAYIHNFDKKEYQETFEFLKNLPVTPEKLIYRLMLKYYQALLDQNRKDIEKYGSILKDEEFFCVLQEDNQLEKV